jgi:glyoxylase-like metal-dependent hydrolase (beta-lactamase superfamily II)
MDMKKYFFIVVTIFTFIVGANVSYSKRNDSDTLKLSDDLIVRKIEKDMYIVTHSFPWPANSLLCKLTSSDYILIDTPWENNATRLLVEWIRQNNSKMNLRVINTHFHRDNLGGNGYLLEQNIPVYGSDLTVKLLDEKLKDPDQDNIADILERPEYKRYYETFKKTELKPPNHTFKINNGFKFDIGNETVEIYYPGAGHTRDNIVAYFHQRKILFGGCIVKALRWKGLGYTGDADIKEWPHSLKKILKKFPQSRIVIPGHGAWGDLRLIHHTLKLLRNQKE